MTVGGAARIAVVAATAPPPDNWQASGSKAHRRHGGRSGRKRVTCRLHCEPGRGLGDISNQQPEKRGIRLTDFPQGQTATVLALGAATKDGRGQSSL